MAYRRKPLYHFVDTTETGVDKVPLNRVIQVESTDYLYIKDNNTGLTTSSTIQDAITSKNIKRLIYTGQAFDLYVDYSQGDIVSYDEKVYYASGTPIGIPGIDNNWIEVGADFDFSIYTEDEELKYDATNMTDFEELINTSIVSNALDASQAIDTTDRIDTIHASTVDKIYLDNQYITAEVGDTITTDQGDVIVKEVHHTSSYDIDNIGYNGFGSFTAPDKIFTGESYRGWEKQFKIENDKLYYKANTGIQIPLSTGLTSYPDREITTEWKLMIDDVYAFYAALVGNDSYYYIRKSDLRLFVIGRNVYGQFGLGDTTDRTTWTDTGMTGVVKLAFSGNTSNTENSIILKNDGTVWVAGYNHSGQLGIGNNNQQNTWIQSASNAVDISLRGANSMYIDNSNNVYSCGYNTNGEIGDGTTAGSYSWVLIKTDGLRLSQSFAAVYGINSYSNYIDTSNRLVYVDSTGANNIVDTNVKKYFDTTGNAPYGFYSYLKYDGSIGAWLGVSSSISSLGKIDGVFDNLILGQITQPTVNVIKNNIIYQAISPEERSYVFASNKSATIFGNMGIKSTNEYISNADLGKYYTEYWIVPETPLGTAPSTAYLNMHKANAKMVFQGESEAPWTALTDTTAYLNKVDLIDSSKTQAVNKIFIDPASYTVRENEYFCTQTGEIFKAKSINQDASGYWIEPNAALTTIPSAVYGLISLKLNDTEINPSSVVLNASDIEELFSDTYLPYVKQYQTKVKLTDDLVMTELIGTLYKAY